MINKYAQYGEEDFLISFFDKRIGFLCDIGAADGVRYSNSKYLIERGWSALLVEPNKSNFAKIAHLYSNNANVKVDNSCCFYEDRGIIDFYCDTYDGFGQISTMSDEFRDVCEKMYQPKYVIEKVSCLKTSSVLTRNSVPKNIDFVSIDCEGVDFEVLRGIDFSLHNIYLFCIENRDQKIHDFMNEKGYKKVHQTEGNVFYAKSV